MMNNRRSLSGDERGAVLVQVAIAILVLTAMATFVVDHGVLLVSRGQAQNAADAGALSGAIARAFDDPGATPGEKTTNSARKTAEQNLVWKQTPAADVTWNCPPGVTGSCVTVDVYRGAPDRTGTMRGDPLPLFFGPVLKIMTHGVRATATARVSNGNATNCLRPFAVIDLWHEFRTPLDELNRWDSDGNQLSGAVDWSEPPQGGSKGSGYSVPEHVGYRAVLKMQNGNDIGPGWSLPVRLPDGNGEYVSGKEPYREAIKNCIGNPVSIGDYLPKESGEGIVGPTAQGVKTDTDKDKTGPSLWEQDPQAEWDAATKSVKNSCASDAVPCGPFSPRIVPIATFDLDEFLWRSTSKNWSNEWIPGTANVPGHSGPGSFSCPGNADKGCVRVTNIIGFFVEDIVTEGPGTEVIGRVVMYPGEFVEGKPNLGSGSSFLQVIQLVR